MNTKGKIFLFLFGLVLLILAWLGVRHFLALGTLVVNYENINSISIYGVDGLDSHGDADEKPVKTIGRSGEEISLEKGSYILQYDAADNYQDHFVAIELNEKRQTVNISPEHSQEYFDKILDSEIDSIDKVIQEKYPKTKSLYEIQRGSLYKDGEWYGTTLLYKGGIRGDNFLKTDTLRIILKKENGQWAIKTNPPNILFNKYAYPDVPEDILRSVNNLSPTPSQENL